ncbi:MAG: FMN-binding protein [Spongiibacteraceae bacterium]
MPSLCFAKGDYLTDDQFLARIFPERSEQPQALWLNASIKNEISQILTHEYNGLRVRYWRSGSRTAWIFNEIGKELPITIGVGVDQNQVMQIEILSFRESRGGEVRYPFFRDQFQGVSLADDHRLSKTIDGISGATMSVRAVSRVTRLALYLHQLALVEK